MNDIRNFDYEEFITGMEISIHNLRTADNEVASGYADVLEKIFSVSKEDFLAYIDDAKRLGIDDAGVYLSAMSGISSVMTVIPGILLYILGRLNNDGQPMELVDYGLAYKIDTSDLDEIENPMERLAAKIEARTVSKKSEPFARVMNIKMPQDRDEFMRGEDDFYKFLEGTLNMIEDTHGFMAPLWNIIPELQITKRFFASCYLLGRTEGCDETLAEVQP